MLEFYKLFCLQIESSTDIASFYDAVDPIRPLLDFLGAIPLAVPRKKNELVQALCRNIAVTRLEKSLHQWVLNSGDNSIYVSPILMYSTTRTHSSWKLLSEMKSYIILRSKHSYAYFYAGCIWFTLNIRVLVS